MFPEFWGFLGAKVFPGVCWRGPELTLEKGVPDLRCELNTNVEGQMTFSEFMTCMEEEASKRGIPKDALFSCIIKSMDLKNEQKPVKAKFGVEQGHLILQVSQ